MNWNIIFSKISSGSPLSKTWKMFGTSFLLVTWISSIVASSSFQFKHHNNVELLKVLENVHQECPNITRIYTLSETSVRGVPLYVIEFSIHPGQHESRMCTINVVVCKKMLKVDTNNNFCEILNWTI